MRAKNLYKRVNDRMERRTVKAKEDEREMKAMIAYIEYIGSNVCPKRKKKQMRLNL
jgi:thiosulfate dehydrogenase